MAARARGALRSARVDHIHGIDSHALLASVYSASEAIVELFESRGDEEDGNALPADYDPEVWNAETALLQEKIVDELSSHFEEWWKQETANRALFVPRCIMIVSCWPMVSLFEQILLALWSTAQQRRALDEEPRVDAADPPRVRAAHRQRRPGPRDAVRRHGDRPEGRRPDGIQFVLARALPAAPARFF